MSRAQRPRRYTQEDTMTQNRPDNHNAARDTVASGADHIVHTGDARTGGRDHVETHQVEHDRVTAPPAPATTRPPVTETATTTAGTAGGAHATTERVGEVHGRDTLDVVEREHQVFGGVKVGSAFFGWLTATGMVVLLTALVSGIAAAIGASTDTIEGLSGSGAQTAGVVSAITFLVILFIAYFAGGYVAGRMARFDGYKQGFAVWAWAIAIALILGILGAVAGSQLDLFGSTGALAGLNINQDALTTSAIIGGLVAVVTSLLGALLGGKSGEKYHRAVDAVGLGRRTVRT